MSKLNNPNQRNVGSVDRNPYEDRSVGRTQKYTSGNAASDMRHNHIKEGPQPGERSGVSRSDGPHERGTGKAGQRP